MAQIVIIPLTVVVILTLFFGYWRRAYSNPSLKVVRTQMVMCYGSLQSDSKALESAVGSPQASVRQRAARVQQLLGLTQRASRPAEAASAPQAVNAPDLLGGLEDEGPLQPAPANPTDLLGEHLQ